MSDLRGRRADTTRRWVRAGQRVTDGQADAWGSQLAAQRRAEQHAAEVAHDKSVKQAHAAWLAGELVPYRISMYLDMRGLEGPEVDERCLAREPDVDRWEAGTLYPSWEQVLALAELVDIPPRALFIQPGDPAPLRWQDTTLRHHAPDPGPPPQVEGQLDLFAEPEPPGPVLRFTAAALATAVGRHGIRPAPDLRLVGQR